LTYTDSTTDMTCLFNFCLQRLRKLPYAKIQIYWEVVHSKQYLYPHSVNIIFLLFYCEVTIGSSEQVLTGTTPLNQKFENSFHTL
jgi:hypothetical protein